MALTLRELGAPHPWMEELLDDPEVFEGVSRGVVPRADFNLEMIPEGGRFFGVFLGDSPSGFFTVLPKSTTECEIHTTMGKQARGKVAIDAMRGVLRVLSGQGVRRVTSFCYSDKPHTIWFAKKCGFSVMPTASNSQKTHVEIWLSSQQ